jgi:hypothetical protein
MSCGHIGRYTNVLFGATKHKRFLTVICHILFCDEMGLFSVRTVIPFLCT